MASLISKKFRFDPAERQALLLGLIVGRNYSDGMSDSESQIYSEVIQEIIYSRDSRGVAHQDSQRRTTQWYSKKERRLIREMLRSAYDSDGTRPELDSESGPFDDSDRALVLHLLNVFEKAR